MNQNAKNTQNQLEKSHIRLEFPELLPVSGQRKRIMEALEANQVIIVCGETGSGKTTQLPKICLAMGRGRINGTKRLIGHTQPRRIAATSTAKRIADELGTPIGQDVGYQVRFSDQTSTTASIKLMTDGILLAQTQKDPLLLAYDTIIIDEAHERSLNIDFLLGYLRQILPKRPDLKVIITSATIDASMFAKHFDFGKEVPIIEVSGRLFPVEIRYRPLTVGNVKEDKEISEGVLDAIMELWGQGVSGMGDILVFLPGEREIRDCAELLRKSIPLQQRYHPDILSLFARQSVAEQERVFQTGRGRRIILATNVAETSLTVPGIRFVVDAGTARIKRYSYRNKVEQLQIEAISQSAANQRAGRCGRVADGICIRLYGEDEFGLRPAYTDPEIMRSSLAGVILRMASLRLSKIDEFPFIQAPTGRAISDGIQLLEELGALEAQYKEGAREITLTPIGQELAQLPLDPRVSRMLIAAKEHVALREVLIIASAMALQDPRERPPEFAQQADVAHKIFADEQSEFISFIKLWDWYHQAAEKKTSNRQFDELCKKHFLSPRRMREWRDVHQQLQEILIAQGWRMNALPATYEQIHTSLLTGLLGNIGKKSDEDQWFEGARGIKLTLWPGNHLLKKPKSWIVAGELVETNRLYARNIANIEPKWVERICQHRLQKTWSEPFWDTRTGEVMAHEQGALYGLSLYHGRKIKYALMEPIEARKIFIQRALVEGALLGQVDIGQIQKQSGKTFQFFWKNQQIIQQVEALEHRSRRQDVLVGDQIIYEFYAEVLPETVLSRSSLQTWLDKHPSHAPQLILSKEDLMRHEAAHISDDRYPKQMPMMGTQLALHYHFEPGSPKDGVTLVVPLALLNQVDERRCAWLVPGLCVEKIHLLLKTLPQKLRRHFVPLPEFAKNFIDDCLENELFGKGELFDALIKYIREKTQVVVTRADFRPENLPSHCMMNYRMMDEHGRQLDLDRNLAQLRTLYAKDAREIFQEAASMAIQEVSRSSEPTSKPTHPLTPQDGQAEPTKITDWSFGELPEMLEIQKGKQSFYGYPALEDCGTHCELNVYDDPELARKIHFRGMRRLCSFAHKETLKLLQKQLPGGREIGLLFMQIGTHEEIMQQILDLAIERSCLVEPLPKNAEEFKARMQVAKTKLSLIAQDIAKQALQCLELSAEIPKKLNLAKSICPPAYEDMQNQYQQLVNRQFVAQTPYEQMVHLPRYLKGMMVRVEKLRSNLTRDQDNQKQWQLLQRQYVQVMKNQGNTEINRELQDIRWQLEELRIALYAQELKTPTPMSVKRIEKILNAIRG
ncbi:ATP-dependent helicase [Polynucleobacter sp. SHI8]|uniref:ATP-dependent RNA helicase HrpA n=1 Tax=unclassified Polynucleobacter TaxID=2640945 RepID=UPI002493B339|nr:MULTISPECIES: ATP-dependent RNA helicase HrpA [unclassified Polynucleobacter]BDW10926.1 ATP-dependent helicase [Polynucleobacter sp. SHI2]BDW13372.1 ATP-dependent helicase [Polynucleobacter sp. SHI8]